MKSASVVAVLTIFSAAAIGQNGTGNAPANASCVALNQAAITQAEIRHSAEAEALLRIAKVSGDDGGEHACPGQVLSNMARIVLGMGRIAEAERLAEQSVWILDKLYPPNDWAMLRPLQMLAIVRLEAGQTARARDAVHRIQSIQTKGPEDRSILHATVGALLQIEGRRSEAEAEYLDAFRASEEGGRSASADAAAILHCLGTLYVEEDRLDEARRALNRALAIYNRAKDVVPIDRITFLNVRGVLHARLGEWQESEQDLCDALSMIDQQAAVDADLLRSVLSKYSYVLRRNHQRREARSIEARAAALPNSRTTGAVVDVADLLVEKKAVRR